MAAALTEIPTELANVFSRLEDWQPPHTGRQVNQAADKAIKPCDLRLSLPHDINAYPFSKYATDNIRTQPLGRKTIAIPAPFLPKQNSQDVKESVAISKLLQYYLLDTMMSDTRSRVVADYIVQKGLNTEALRDEIYVQLCSAAMASSSTHPAFGERCWVLIANCLSCFPPSRNLAKYLLKYVSDHAHDGYKAFCQHKLVQCMRVDRGLCRSYAPCLLEWSAATDKACMALPATFADGESSVCHVDSWMTAEQFTANVLRNRQVAEGSTHGWTVALREGGEWYECAGYDYVMDLVAEVEVPPAFPCNTAYFLVSSDKAGTAGGQRRSMQDRLDVPHNTHRPRLMTLDVDELAQPILVTGAKTHRKSTTNAPTDVVSPRQPALSPRQPPLQQRQAVLVKKPTPVKTVQMAAPPPEDKYVEKVKVLSKDSALNKRTEVLPEALSMDSALNARYTSAVEPAATGNADDADVMYSNIRDTPLAAGPKTGVRRAHTLNIGQNFDSGTDPRDALVVDSPMNQRYAKKIGGPSRNPAQQARRPSETGGGDMNEFINNAFQDVFDDDLGDATVVRSKLRGGGDNVMSPVAMNYGYGTPGYALPPQQMMTPYGMMAVPAAPITVPSMYAGQPQGAMPLGVVGPYSPPPMAHQGFIVNPADQMQQQQLLQQQQQQLLQQQQRQQHQMARQQSDALQVQLDAQRLENQLLQQNVENERLKQELQQLQHQSQGVQPARVVQPATTSPGAVVAPAVNRQTSANVTSPRGWQSRNSQAGAIRMQAATPARTPGPVSPPAIVVNGSAGSVTSNQQPQGIPSPPPPPPVPGQQLAPNAAPPGQHLTPNAAIGVANGHGMTNGTTVDQELVSTVAVAAVTRQTDLVGTQRRLTGKARIQWPPPPEKEIKKTEIRIGRLAIHEQHQEAAPVVSSQTAEEAQRKIQQRIDAAKAAEAEVAVVKAPVKKLGPPTAVKPAVIKTSISRISEDTSEEPFVEVDVKSRGQVLERQLTSAQWGPKKESVEKASTPPVQTTQLKQRDSVDAEAPPVVVRPPVKSVIEAPFDVKSLDGVHSVLYAQITSPFYTYTKVPWRLEIRKEVFSPTETVADGNVTDMIFMQIVSDVYAPDCIRLGKDDRNRMKLLLENKNIHPRSALAACTDSVKKDVINAARELPFYFSKMFPVNGGRREPTIQLIAVNHNGVRMLTRRTSPREDFLEVIESWRFDEVIDICVPKQGALQIYVADQYFILYTPRANQIHSLIHAFRIESDKSAKQVTAIRNYQSTDPTELSFQKGDVIRLTQSSKPLESGYLYGTSHGRSGVFPADYVMADNSRPESVTQRPQDKRVSAVPVYSMEEYAALHFKRRPGVSQLSDRDCVELVRWTGTPIQTSLLPIAVASIRIATTCFSDIMKFMGDLPIAKLSSKVDCLRTVLLACSKHNELKDEVYCQLVKQLTNNVDFKSAQYGWRMLTLLTCCFNCSDTLRPYLEKYLSDNATDDESSYKVMASMCLHSLRKTLELHGRKTLPQLAEMEACEKGHMNRRVECMLPGHQAVQVDINSGTVVNDVIAQVCEVLGVIETVEQDEFIALCFIKTDHRCLPMEKTAYVLDVLNQFSSDDCELRVQRAIWLRPLQLSTANKLYVDVLYEQCIADYLAGHLVTVPGTSLPTHVKDDISHLAALQMRAEDRASPVKEDQLRRYLPQNVHDLADMRMSKWCSNIYDHWHRGIMSLEPLESRIDFLEKISGWTMFGASFFMVKAVRGSIRVADCILAVIGEGLYIMNPRTNETEHVFPFRDTVSVQDYVVDRGGSYLMLKCGKGHRAAQLELDTEDGEMIRQLIQLYNALL